jgi:predicted  nucleic acid-binding Zn-ribbon protein
VDSRAEASIQQLAALQELDRQRREKTDLLLTLDAEVAELEHRLELQRTTTTTALTERNALELRRRELEQQLETEEMKMKDRRMRLNRVRNEKELQALRREIELGKEGNQQIEEETLRIMESLDTLATAATEAQQALSELETSAATQIAERRTRISQLKAEVERDRETRNRTADTLDASLLQKYEQIFERRGGTAVVEVRNGTCLGCHMHLPPQFFNELQRSREVRLCPNCHRILYWRPDRLESAEPPR